MKEKDISETTKIQRCLICKKVIESENNYCTDCSKISQEYRNLLRKNRIIFLITVAVIILFIGISSIVVFCVFNKGGVRRFVVIEILIQYVELFAFMSPFSVILGSIVTAYSTKEKQLKMSNGLIVRKSILLRITGIVILVFAITLLIGLILWVAFVLPLMGM